jgi:glycosyltransferase involved in cell wall biosynthesis
VICISEATRTDLLDYQRLSPERAVVVRLGGNDRPPLGSPPPAIGEPYLFYPANAYPHKNHVALLRAFQRFRSEHPDLPGRLILCGLVQPQLARALRECRPEARIEHVGYVSRERLAALYADCTAVLIPSLFEGFGIPLIEAMGYGKKIFCAELPVFRELAGDAVEYFDATSEAAIAAQCARIFSRPAWPVDRAAYAGILAELNWEQCARQTYELLSEVAASRPAIAAEAQRRAA